MDFVCTSFPFRPNMICRYIVRRGREASNSKRKWYHSKDSLQQANCLLYWYSGHRLCQLAMKIIKDHQKNAMVQAQRVWNVWNWRALYQFSIYLLCWLTAYWTLHAWTDTRGIRLISAPHWLLNALQRLERELPNQWRLAVVVVGSNPEIPNSRSSKSPKTTAIEWC